MKVITNKLLGETVIIDVLGITLLCLDEYNEYRPYIPEIKGKWWLRSSCKHNTTDVLVAESNYPFIGRSKVSCPQGARPALIISIIDAPTLRLGDKVCFDNLTWTLISNEYTTYLLCDDFIFVRRFNDGREGKVGRLMNDYEKSEVKERLEKWLSEALS